ncbi:hypothetical protein BLAT2472_30323 [Burkholderia latens]
MGAGAIHVECLSKLTGFFFVIECPDDLAVPKEAIVSKRRLCVCDRARKAVNGDSKFRARFEVVNRNYPNTAQLLRDAIPFLEILRRENIINIGIDVGEGLAFSPEFRHG